MILVGAALKAPEKVALYGSGTDALTSTQATPVDAIEVLLMDHLLEALAGSLAGLNAWQALAKESAATQTLAFAHLEAENHSAESPVLMPYLTLAPALVSQARSAAAGTRYRSGIPGRYPNRAAVSLDVANLEKG